MLYLLVLLRSGNHSLVHRYPSGSHSVGFMLSGSAVLRPCYLLVGLLFLLLVYGDFLVSSDWFWLDICSVRSTECSCFFLLPGCVSWEY